MPQLTASNFRLRKEFSRIKKVVDIPNLIELQRNSYIKFLQFDALPDQRKDEGLQTIFKSVFPITDFNNTASLEFVSYSFEKPKYEMLECRQRGMTYEVPVNVIVRLVVWDNDPETGAQ